MNAFIDIGFTLLGGPKLSPPKAIAKILGMDASDLNNISEMVFTQNHTEPLSLTDSLEKHVGRKIERGERSRIVDFWNGQYEEVYELEWACGFVEGLIDAGINVHIVSNLWFPFHDKFRQIFSGSYPLIKSETLSFKEGVKKPDPKFYRIALDRSGAEASNSFSVGDSLGNDILPYAEMGMKCIWYVSRPLDEDKLIVSEKILAKYAGIHKVSNLRKAFEIMNRENLKMDRGL